MVRCAIRLTGGVIHWSLDDDNWQVDIAVELTGPPRNVHNRAGVANAGAVLSEHVDAPCRVTGTMIARGRTYQISEKGVRDHVWGTRDLGSMRSHR